MKPFGKWMIAATAVMTASITTAAENPPTDPQGFVQGAMQSGMLEVELGRLAQSRSADARIDEFAARMVADHGKANAELAALAKAKSIEVPASLDGEHARQLKQLQDRKGKAFERAYAEHMVHDHAAALDLFQANVSHPDGELAAFAGRTLPVLQEHKRLADNLKANLK